MAWLKTALLTLLVISMTHANGSGEFRFVNGYIIEFHPGDTFEFGLYNESGSPVEALPLVHIYKEGVLIQESTASAVNNESYYVKNNLTSGKYEIRPIFSVENRTIAARFDYSKEGGIIDQIISFLVHLFFPEKTTDVHEHADLAVYINGEKLNLSQEKYMENSSRPMSELIHLHDMNGNIIHKHVVGVNLGHFFGTMDMMFNSTCFADYCNVHMYVNGKQNDEFDKYEFSDLDRILIAVGNYTQEETDTMINSVTNDSCIQSGKCPERGNPSDEGSCTTAGGCR